MPVGTQIRPRCRHKWNRKDLNLSQIKQRTNRNLQRSKAGLALNLMQGYWCFWRLSTTTKERLQQSVIFALEEIERRHDADRGFVGQSFFLIAQPNCASVVLFCWWGNEASRQLTQDHANKSFKSTPTNKKEVHTKVVLGCFALHICRIIFKTRHLTTIWPRVNMWETSRKIKKTPKSDVWQPCFGNFSTIIPQSSQPQSTVYQHGGVNMFVRTGSEHW